MNAHQNMEQGNKHFIINLKKENLSDSVWKNTEKEKTNHTHTKSS